MNTKGVDLLNENIVFLILILIFVGALFIHVSRAGSQAALYEQVYAKKIALLIDKAKPGMDIELELFDAFRLARKNKFQGTIVTIDNALQKVNVRLYDAQGYDFYYVNDVAVAWNVDTEQRLLILKIREAGEVS